MDSGPAPARVSVVIPAFNAALEINDALASVCRQTFSDFEVIVVNDGSHDTVELERVLGSYSSHIRYFVQPNRGAGAARNVALRAARGEYVAFLDADDRWRPDFLLRQIAFLDAHPDCLLVYCDALISGESPLAGQRFSEGAPSFGPVTALSLVRQTCNIPLSTVVARRHALLEVGLFDESLRRGQDFDLWLRLALRGAAMSYQRAVLAERRVRRAGLSGNAECEVRRAIDVLERFGRTHAIDNTLRMALHGQLARLHDRLAIEQAKQRICERRFEAARASLSRVQQPSLKIRMLMLALKLAPRLAHRLYVSLRPGEWLASAIGAR